MAKNKPVKSASPAAATPAAAAPVAQAPARSEVKGSGTAKPAAAAPRQVSDEQIARRAFEIYAGRGYAPGDPTADWLEAERQLRAGL